MRTGPGSTTVRELTLLPVQKGKPPMLRDVYLQPDAPDPVLADARVLELARRYIRNAHAVTAVDESGGEARTYAVDDTIIVKTQRPHRLRPRTSLEKEVCFLKEIARQAPALSVPRVLGYGREGSGREAIEYTCMTRMPGVALRHAALSVPERQAVLRALGASLRRVHELTQAAFVDSGLFPADKTPADFHARMQALFGRAHAQMQAEHREWRSPGTPEGTVEQALAALPADGGERVALHSNPGPEHTFVHPESRVYSGLIDFGDAYISHPALDLRVWRLPADRAALFAGYTAAAPVSAPFLATWRVVQVLADMVTIAFYPQQAAEAYADLAVLLAG